VVSPVSLVGGNEARMGLSLPVTNARVYVRKSGMQKTQTDSKAMYEIGMSATPNSIRQSENPHRSNVCMV
jgi:hypothetical protein